MSAAQKTARATAERVRSAKARRSRGLDRIAICLGFGKYPVVPTRRLYYVYQGESGESSYKIK